MVTVSLDRDDAFDLYLELLGAISYLEMLHVVKPGESGPHIRALIQALHRARWPNTPCPINV